MLYTDKYDPTKMFGNGATGSLGAAAYVVVSYDKDGAPINIDGLPDFAERYVKSMADRIEAMEAALRQAQSAMNYMGDILNGMDAVLPEDVAATTEAFEAVSAALEGK
jgi:hypothetical protein